MPENGHHGGSGGSSQGAVAFRATGRHVQRLRARLDLNQRDFALLVGVSGSLVGKWESDGEISLSHFRLLQVLWIGPAKRIEPGAWRQILRSSGTDDAKRMCFMYLAGVLPWHELRDKWMEAGR